MADGLVSGANGPGTALRQGCLGGAIVLAAWAVVAMREAGLSGAAIPQATATFALIGAGHLLLVDRGPGGAGQENLFRWLVLPMIGFAFGAGIAVLDGAHRLASPASAGGDVSMQLIGVALAGGLSAAAVWWLRKTPVDPPGGAEALAVTALAALAVAVLSGAGLHLWSSGQSEADGGAAIGIGLVMAVAAVRMSLLLRHVLMAPPAHVLAAADVELPIQSAQAGAAEPVRSIEVVGVATGREAGVETVEAMGGAPRSGQKPAVVARQGKRRGKRR